MVTKLDVLDNLAEIPVGIAYEYKGKTFREVPSEIDALGEVKVRYKTLPGWQQSTFGVTECGAVRLSRITRLPTFLVREVPFVW